MLWRYLYGNGGKMWHVLNVVSECSILEKESCTEYVN